MNWSWPAFLLLLGGIPLLVGSYIWMQRRPRRVAVRYSSLSLLRAAMPNQFLWRRHLPFALFLLALASLVMALSRPYAVVNVPSGRATIILSLDVSRSMCSTDIRPSRMEAARAAAREFIRNQEDGTQIGIVAFAGYAELVQPPTTDQNALQAAVASLTTGRRTAIGSGIIKALEAIAEVDENVAPIQSDMSSSPGPTSVPEGKYAPAIIVLLTDGVSNTGPPPLDAAQLAIKRGIRVYTIGFGTDNESIPDCLAGFGNNPFGNDPFFGQPGGGFSGGFRRGIDEETLEQIAASTGGIYYSAESSGELQDVFSRLPTHLSTRPENIEISVFFAAFAALVASLAFLLASLWHPLP
jgi:Ca-activated chloride channel family protein